MYEADSMGGLWRQIHVIQTGDAEDEMVIAQINKLKTDGSAENKVLKELCEMQKECNLGGLPLKLVQAGSYFWR